MTLPPPNKFINNKCILALLVRETFRSDLLELFQNCIFRIVFHHRIDQYSKYRQSLSDFVVDACLCPLYGFKKVNVNKSETKTYKCDSLCPTSALKKCCKSLIKQTRNSGPKFD